jgi:hypothetical protein
MAATEEESLPPSVLRLAVCRTEGCAVEGTAFEVVLYGPSYACVCGRCGQPHTDLTDVALSANS